MLITLDTQKMDNPDQFGELFRKLCFKEETGCYSCFDLTDDFKKVSPTSQEGLKLLKVLDLDSDALTNRLKNSDQDAETQDWIKSKHEEDYNKAIHNLYSNGTILIGWFWDGDGTLAIIEGEKAVINYDCKKDYTWQWVDF